MSYDLSHEHLEPDANGMIHLPEAPGLGITPNLEAIRKYSGGCGDKSQRQGALQNAADIIQGV